MSWALPIVEPAHAQTALARAFLVIEKRRTTEKVADAIKLLLPEFQNRVDPKLVVNLMRCVAQLGSSLVDTSTPERLFRNKQAYTARKTKEIKDAVRARKLDDVVRAECADQGRVIAISIKLADLIRPGVRKKLDCKPADTWPSRSAIKCGDKKENIARAEGDSLKQRCARAASAALLAGHFPSKGARHDAGLTLGGFLSRCGFSRPDTELFAEAVTIASGQPMEKVKDVRKAAMEAWDEGDRPGGNARGFPALAETFGDDVAKHVAKWLGFSGERINGRAAASSPSGTADAAEQWTELGNAHRLVRRHGEDVRYVHPLKAWFIWDGVFWRRDDSGEIMRRAEATIEAIFDEAKEITDEEIRTAFRKFALKSQSNAQLRAMTQLAQHNLQVVLSPDALDANAMLLGVLNGTIDLNTCAFREGRREDYITKQCAVAFDRAARCPNWIAFQNKIAGGNADLVAYKQRLFGLLLTGEMVEILFILHGGGQNGKSTEFETISGLLGDYAHAADAQVLLSPRDRGVATPEIVAVKNKRAVFINETGESDHLNESRVKGDVRVRLRLCQISVLFIPVPRCRFLSARIDCVVMAVMPSSAHELVGLELQLKQVGDARRRFRRFVRTRDGEIALIGPRNLARRLLTGIEALDRLLLLMRVRVRLRRLGAGAYGTSAHRHRPARRKARGIWGTRRSGAVGARVVPPPSYPRLFERTRCNAGRTERLKSGARRRKALDVEASAGVFQNYHLESQTAGVFGGP